MKSQNKDFFRELAVPILTPTENAILRSGVFRSIQQVREPNSDSEADDVDIPEMPSHCNPTLQESFFDEPLSLDELIALQHMRYQIQTPTPTICDVCKTDEHTMMDCPFVLEI